MKDRRIVIVGFMGSGKTTVGRALAQRLGREMIDLDAFITEREGRTPAEIQNAIVNALKSRALQSARRSSPCSRGA